MRCLCVCVCVCVSVWPSRSWILSKRVIVSSQFFSPSGSHTILVFPHQTARQYSDGNPTNGASNAGGVVCIGRNRDSEPCNIWLHCSVLWTVPVARAIHLAATDHDEFITLVAAGKRPSLLTAGNNDEVYNKKPQRYAENSVTQW